MDANGVLIIAGGAIVIAALAYETHRVAREERAWREDPARCARNLARAELASGSFREEDIAIAEAIAEEWHPLDELDRLESEERDAEWLGAFAPTAEDIAHLSVFRASDWMTA